MTPLYYCLDRREAAHALSKLQVLNGLKKLERKTLPWGNTLEEMDTINVIDVLNKMQVKEVVDEKLE